MITKEYVFECILKGCPIKMEQEPKLERHNFREEFALLRSLGVIRPNEIENTGATLTHPISLGYRTLDGDYKVVTMHRGHSLPPVPKKQ